MNPGDDLDEHVNRLVDAAPPLTNETRARLSALLRPLTTPEPATTRRPTAADQRKAA